MNSKPKTLVAIDASNIYYAVSNEGWQVNWEKFIIYLNQNYNIILPIFYCGIESKNVFLSKHTGSSESDFIKSKKQKLHFFKILKTYGYRVKSKPVTQVYDSTSGKFNRKCNFDVEIVIDAIRYLNDYDVFMLVSGDGDFIPLVKYIKGKYKKVIVISHKHHTNNGLVKAANQTIFLRTIKQHIIK